MTSKHLWLLVVMLLFSGVEVSAQGTTMISGVVQRADGSREKGALVNFYPYGPSSGLSMSGETNEKGEFAFSVHYIGPGMLSASKVDEGYPDAVVAFYVLNDYTSAHEISPNGTAIQNVLLTFSEPTPMIKLSIALRGRTVSSVQVTVRSITRPDVYSTTSWEPEKAWYFVIPKDLVTISVTAPNHETWTYNAPSSTSIKDKVVALKAELKETATPRNASNQ